MAFHVSSERVDKNVRTLARLTGQSVTDAIDGAVVEKLRRLQPHKVDKNYVSDLLKLSDEIAAMLTPDSRTADELLDYDEDGLPR